jgi:hypothetical protein
MFTMTYIRPISHGELATFVRDETRSKPSSASRWTWLETGMAMATVGAAVIVMAGLMALRLWFLMPASFHFPG